MPKNNWGYTPHDIALRLYSLYWHNFAKRKALLLGDVDFPLRCNLHAPTDTQLKSDESRYRGYIDAWSEFSESECFAGTGIKVLTKQKRFSTFGYQTVPQFLSIPSSLALLRVLALHEPTVTADVQRIELVVSELLSLTFPQHSYRVVYSNRDVLSAIINDWAYFYALSPTDLHRLALTLPQLLPGMGNGAYIRSLALTNVDTKFLEEHATHLWPFILFAYETSAGDLYEFLNVIAPPRGWALVSAGDKSMRTALMGLVHVRALTSDIPALIATLASKAPLRLLIIENEQCAYALPELPNTLIVAGCGVNVSWLSQLDKDASVTCPVFYWGDIDSAGFKILAHARKACSRIQSLMMGKDMLEKHSELVVDELKTEVVNLEYLTSDELESLNHLVNQTYKGTRLEQERIASDIVLFYLCHMLDS